MKKLKVRIVDLIRRDGRWFGGVPYDLLQVEYAEPGVWYTVSGNPECTTISATL